MNEQNTKLTPLDFKNNFGLNSFSLHIIAMLCMLLDHMWASVITGQAWMTCVGRIAFPIFAFMTVEAFYLTHDRKRHMIKLLIFAIISEIPFNLISGGSIFFPIHQNVLWTFLMANVFMLWNEKVKEKKKIIRVIVAVFSVFLSSFLGLVTMLDYYSIGIPTVLLFYFFREKKPINMIIQILGMIVLNMYTMRGMEYEFVLFGHTMYFPQQGFALLALVFIWLYNGKQGPYNKVIKNIYYWFYPLHCLILGLIALW